MIKFFRKQSFLFSAIILAVGGILAKIIGAFYKIPLTNILGANGMGVYYLIFPIYSLFLVISSSGISIAVTKLIATERKLRNRENEIKIFNSGLIFSFGVSFILSLIILFFARDISIMQGNENAYLGYMVIAPAIICASLISILRAYFQGVENFVPTSFSTIVEQIVKLIFGLFLSIRFLNYGIEYAVVGAVLGVTISEFFAMVLLLINFYFYKKREKDYLISNRSKNKSQSVFLFYNPKVFKYKNLKKGKIEKGKWNENKKSPDLTKKQTFLKVLKYSLPATLSSFVIPATTFIDSFMVINILVGSGFSSSMSTSLYGLTTGVVGSLISLPVLLVSSLSTAIIPNLSGTYASEEKRVVEERVAFFIKITWLIALPLFAYFLIYSNEIVSVLFGGGLSFKGFDELAFASKLMMIGSVEIVYYAFLLTFIAILQAINKPIIPMICLLIGLGFRTLLCLVLVNIPSINVFGILISNILFLSLTAIACLIAIKKYINFNISKKSFLIYPVLAVSVSVFVALSFKAILLNYMSKLAYSIISGGLGVLVYLLLILNFAVFTEKEIALMPFPKKIFRRIES